MPTFLNAFSLRFYRGIGPKAQRITGLRPFNFFIGTNNAGKSIVLNALYGHLSPSSGGVADGSVEAYRGKTTGKFELLVGIQAFDFRARVETNNVVVERLLDKIVAALSVDDHVWILPPNGTRFELKYADTSNVRTCLTDNEWRLVWATLTDSGGGSVDQHWVPETLRYLLTKQVVAFPKVHMIPAKREIGPTGAKFEDLTGRGLIDQLAMIQSPDHHIYEQSRRQFTKINEFLASVTDTPGARIEIPHNRTSVLVDMNDKILPLSSLGTGIHEVIMIAAFSTIHEESIMCIEEPEIHLHPILQKKLINYLQNNTSNQYFIATHSAAFIDTKGAGIFHVTTDGSQTYIQGTELRSDRYRVCADLGYKASDILQSNAVIWVEGPSDRVYLNHWLHMKDDSLIEGVHYSIMFYGGRLLSHLTGDPNLVSDFIQLRSLNQNSAIVIDSDMKSKSDQINDTKRRLKDEFERGGGFCWVTLGREIENYVDHATLQGAVSQIYEDVYDASLGGGQYDHSLYFKRKSPKARRKQDTPQSESLVEKNIDKVAVARAVCAGTLSTAILDLETQIAALVRFIKVAN